jgi:hypothetical protein
MSDRHQHTEHADHPDWPTTVDETVDRLMVALSKENKQTIREAESMSLFHFSLGMWMRNTFGLWEGNQSLIDSCARRRGLDADVPFFLHPDSASTIILVGFVHPDSGRTLFHLATSVRIPLIKVELTVFARQAGAVPTKQVVLVLDRAGWHTSVHHRVPEHVRLLFLLPYSPELSRLHTSGR